VGIFTRRGLGRRRGNGPFAPNKDELPMDTATLPRLGTYPKAQMLLRSVMLDKALVPTAAEFVTGLQELPTGLRSVLEHAECNGLGWCTWRLHGELRALTGELDETTSRLHARPVLKVLLHDGRGRVVGCSGWLETQPGVWALCELR